MSDDIFAPLPKDDFPPKGDRVPLNISESGKRRVHIGIGWDVREETERKRKLFSGSTSASASDNTYVQMNVEQYDMDLIALIFDENGTLVDAVSPEMDEEMDQSGHIYHSGDNDTGRGDFDDEIISVELLGLPDYINHIVFLVIAQSGHTFGRILGAEARIADGKTDENRLKIKLGQDGGENSTACIFAQIHKRGEEWLLHNISEYRMDKDIEDWAAEIAPYIQKI